ncbi:hypothetical protein BH11PLA1_BH11PLA1_23360 [soil metagenome]
MPSTTDAPRLNPLAGLTLILFTLFSWAAVPLFLHHFSTHDQLNPFAANAWRYGISAAFWLPFLILARFRGHLPNALLRAALIPAALNICGQTLFAWGPAILEPGYFSFIFRVQIIFVTLGAYLLFPGERAALRRPLYWLGIALVIGGSIGLILTGKQHAPTIGGVPALVGIVVALLAGILFAGYGLAVRACVNQYHPVTSFGVICQFTAVGVIAALALAPLADSVVPAALHADALKPVHEFGLYAWFLLVASAFVGIAISHVTYYASIKRLGVAVSIGILQLQPIVTALASIFIFGERLNGVQWGAGVIGIAGAVVMLTAAHTTKRATAAAEEEGN